MSTPIGKGGPRKRVWKSAHLSTDLLDEIIYSLRKIAMGIDFLVEDGRVQTIQPVSVAIRERLEAFIGGVLMASGVKDNKISELKERISGMFMDGVDPYEEDEDGN